MKPPIKQVMIHFVMTQLSRKAGQDWPRHRRKISENVPSVPEFVKGESSAIRGSLKGLSEKPSNPAPASTEGMLRQALVADLKSLRVRQWVVYSALSVAVILFFTYAIALSRISDVNFGKYSLPARHVYSLGVRRTS